MVNLPVFFTSLVATCVRMSMNFLPTAGFCSVFSASAAAMPDLDMAMTAFAFFIGAIVAESEGRSIEWQGRAS